MKRKLVGPTFKSSDGTCILILPHPKDSKSCATIKLTANASDAIKTCGEANMLVKSLLAVQGVNIQVIMKNES